MNFMIIYLINRKDSSNKLVTAFTKKTDAEKFADDWNNPKKGDIRAEAELYSGKVEIEEFNVHEKSISTSEYELER